MKKKNFKKKKKTAPTLIAFGMEIGCVLVVARLVTATASAQNVRAKPHARIIREMKLFKNMLYELIPHCNIITTVN